MAIGGRLEIALEGCRRIAGRAVKVETQIDGAVALEERDVIFVAFRLEPRRRSLTLPREMHDRDSLVVRTERHPHRKMAEGLPIGGIAHGVGREVRLCGNSTLTLYAHALEHLSQSIFDAQKTKASHYAASSADTTAWIFGRIFALMTSSASA